MKTYKNTHTHQPSNIITFMLCMILLSCSAKPPAKVAAGEDYNLYRKADLIAQPMALLGSEGKMGLLLANVDDKQSEKVRFDISKSFLTGYRVSDGSPGSDEPIVQFKIKDHWDLRHEKNKEGQETQFLVKDKESNPDWAQREYIEIDPYDAKRIAPMRATLVNLYDVEKMKKSYVLGLDQVPGLSQRELMVVRTQFRLVDGVLLEIKFTKTEMLIYTKNNTSQPIIVARLPVNYFDLVRSLDEDGEERAELIRDQKSKEWSKRRYVEINPDTTNVQDGDEKLFVKQDLDAKCFTSETLNQDIKVALGAALRDLMKEDQICLDISQSVLSVFKKFLGQRVLLVTFTIAEHVDINLDAEDISDVLPSGKYKNRWDQRRYIRLSLTNPKVAENHVQPNVLTKQDLSGEYVYVATVVSAHSENLKFFAGQTLVGSNRVRFEFTEDKVTAYKVGELLNQSTAPSPALSYAADYFDVGRVRNEVGDGTHIIAEIKDKPWHQRQHVRVNFADNTVQAYYNDFFKTEELYGARFSLRQTRLLSEPQKEQDYVSFLTEEVIVPDPNELWSPSTGSFQTETGPEAMTVVIRHSFMRVDGRSYVAKEYTKQDFARFGYFWTSQNGLDDQGQPTDSSLKYFIGKHDISSDKKIIFYLSAGYPERYREVTEQVITAWNSAFKDATGRDNVVELRENSGQSIGDPRYNMIAFVKDRYLFAPAGYGPSIADPTTGELVSSRAFLYGDAIRYIKASGGDYYDLIKGGKLPSDFASEGSRPSTLPLTTRFPQQQSTWKQIAKTVKGPAVHAAALLSRAEAKAPASLAAALSFGVMKDMRGALEFQDSVKRYHSMQVGMAGRGQCMIGANEHIVSAVKYIQAHMDLSREQLLEDLEMKSVFNIMLHEVGHTLGLRHNFHGSFDELNFHPKYHKLKPLEEQGQIIAGDYAANYRTSSVMDYNDMFEGLAMAPGPYDIAAIKYGYGDLLEVMTKDEQGQPLRDDHGAIIVNDVPKTQITSAMSVRPYKFCTDGHVSEDPTCARFDRGITLSETTRSLAEQYDISYFLKGFRRGQRDFTGSSYGVLTSTLMPMRQVLDELFYKLIQGDFEGQVPSDPVAPGNFADYVAALNESFAFFTKVLNTIEPGTYHFDQSRGEFVTGEGVAADQKLVAPLGVGKFLEAAYIEGASPEEREQIVRRGIEFDKLATMFVLTMRGYPARKYERISLAVNYFAVAKEGVLEILSKYMRDDYKVEVKAVRNPQSDTLVAVPDSYRPQSNEQVVTVKVSANTNLALKINTMIFAIMNYNSTADQTFGDYIDYRIKGVDDQMLADVQDKLEFSAANGLRNYVVPQTNDGLSISYALAKAAPAASKVMIDALAELKGIKADLNVAVGDGFDKVLASVINIYSAALGEELDANTVASLRARHDLETLQTLLSFIADIEGQAQSIGIQELLDLINAERQTWPAALNGIEEKIAKQDGLQTIADDAKRSLTEIESGLIQLRTFYDVFN